MTRSRYSGGRVGQGPYPPDWSGRAFFLSSSCWYGLRAEDEQRVTRCVESGLIETLTNAATTGVIRCSR